VASFAAQARGRTVVAIPELLDGRFAIAFATIPFVSITSDFQRQPSAMEIRVIERDGKRVLQQWRNKPGGMAYEFTWVDVLEFPKRASVSTLTPRR
jgi:hypothetical protein